eukprot:TRINITY_DN56467_c0_g1_i1.p1 TRINITY_DN56467_c0_g1~~TRINITY_DN56467_c0_g1_i1.p1  ORF type:complete len:113 (-),score=6.49 TRINITY_DN56467_c0_g1_i1:229-567(-)
MRPCLLAIQTVAQELPRLEERNVFLFDMNRLAGARVAARAAVPLLDRKGTEAAKLHPVPIGHCAGDAVENGIHNAFHVPVKQMWILIGNLLDQLRADHHLPPVESNVSRAGR